MRATMLLLAALGAVAAFGGEEAGTFKPLGLGGGGGLFTPVGSPHDEKLLLVSCDMGGFYRSTDGGQHWTMLDGRTIRGNTRCLPVFDLKDPKRVYFTGRGKILTSTDAGATWTPTSSETPWNGAVQEIAADPGGGALLWVGTDKGFYRSEDRGATWGTSEGVSGKVCGIFVDPKSPAEKRMLLVGASNGVFRSQDGGKTFEPVREGLPSKPVERLCGGSDADGARVFALIANKIYVSADLGNKWSACEAQGISTQPLRFLAMAQTNAKVLYATDTSGHWGVYKSEDAGKTFKNVFRGHPNDADKNVAWGWLAFDASYGWGGPAIGFSVNAGHPEQAFYTNTGELYGTNDGGTQWTQLFSHCAEEPGAGKRWNSIGLEVTTTWQYTIDPFDPQRMYICYTDIGFARSEDGGATWRHSVKGSPWGNTVYQLAPDPARKGVFYAAAANQHDIPGWTQVDGARAPGGVLLSTDHCATWKPISKGFPEKKPCLSVVLDPTSPQDKRVLYAAVFGEGVYKSADGGETWAKKSEGLGHGDNLFACSLQRTEDGALYCLVTGKRKDLEFGPPGGLWVSKDGAETWTEVTKGQTIWWPTAFAVDPKDSKTILLAAADVPKKQPVTGGLWRTTDGGATWTQTMNQKAFDAALGGYVHAFRPVFDPGDPKRVYFCTWTHGLLMSDDAGQTFKPYAKVPFIATNNVTVDTQNNLIYVCTFGGGVWKGTRPGTDK